MFALGIVTKFASFVFLVLACYLYKLPPDTDPTSTDPTSTDPTSTDPTSADPTSAQNSADPVSDSNHLPVAMTELPSQNVNV